MSGARAPWLVASNPRASVFVAANAGSGKTATLVRRVARLLLRGARPEAILCVTYTKAGAAEMQRRLFDELGKWAVMRDEPLREALAAIDEADRELSSARALFARALETPGGLKIQTIHAFCEMLLRRFPLEAGVSPGFTVLEDAAASEVSKRARDDVAALAMADPDGPVGRAYAHFSVQLDWNGFNGLFDQFETSRAAIAAYAAASETVGGYLIDVWRRCGFGAPTTAEAIGAESVAQIRWGTWRRAAEALARDGGKSDQNRAVRMLAAGPESSFPEIWAMFSTAAGTPLVKLAVNAVDARVEAWLRDEQGRHHRAHLSIQAARVAEDSCHALALAIAYAGAYDGAKNARGGLDFGDLIALAHRLLTVRADAAWVLYKLDGGLEHVLLDEAQDTAPEQWDILRTLTTEFFTGLGAGPVDRTVFAVGDEKQSIFSFQGAEPKRLAIETQTFGAMVARCGARFDPVNLNESWRSAPEILAFVDAVIAQDEILAGIRPVDGDRVRSFPITHIATRGAGGCVEVWPPVAGEESTEVDPWAPVDSVPARGASALLAQQIARAIRAMIARGDGVRDRGAGARRPCVAGDMLILVRRRGVLFEEIIRALKREGVAVAGADRLKLSQHGVFEDLMALGRFARFPSDDLTLAGLLRSPFCEVGEESLFDLAHGRRASLWATLSERAGERVEWRAAAAFLGWARDAARRTAPFDFFGRAMARLDPDGRSMRQRILTRLGAEGEEALDAFIAQTLAAESGGVRDLESFLDAMAASELVIKREQDEARSRAGGEVRVMTVHGAKGLEAPIVILPDTTTRATSNGGAMLTTEFDGFLWAPRAAEDCPASQAARAARELATVQESARLLYVALTRARDRLIVCGVETRDRWFVGSWYDFIRRAFDTLAIRPFAMEGGGEAWRFGVDPAPAASPVSLGTAEIRIPSWAHGLAPAESPLARFASPSAVGDDSATAAPSPLGIVDGLGRYRRGDLIHHLLQWLPDLPAAQRPDAARRILGRERDLTEDQRTEMASAALAVLADPAFAAVFGPGSRAEVALAGRADALPAGLTVSGRVDRLVVEPDRVLVVDYKTNRPAPSRVEDADPNYIRQMAIYVAVLAEAFPDRRIDAALVWTDGPRLMAVPENMLARALDGLRQSVEQSPPAPK